MSNSGLQAPPNVSTCIVDGRQCHMFPHPTATPLNFALNFESVSKEMFTPWAWCQHWFCVFITGILKHPDHLLCPPHGFHCRLLNTCCNNRLSDAFVYPNFVCWESTSIIAFWMSLIITLYAVIWRHTLVAWTHVHDVYFQPNFRSSSKWMRTRPWLILWRWICTTSRTRSDIQ